MKKSLLEQLNEESDRALMHNLIVGTGLWIVLAFILTLFMEEKSYAFESWGLVILSDLVCIFLGQTKRFPMKSLYLYSMLTGLLQTTFLIHTYHMHVVYLLLFLGTVASALNSLMHSETTHIKIYSAMAGLSALSLLMIQAPHSELFALGFSAGIVFMTSSTLTNKRLKLENVQIKTKLEEAKRYAHDINSPLLVIKGRIGQVMRSELQEEDRRKLSIAHRSIDRIAEIVKSVA